MNDKQKFGEYLATKRKNLKLTQEKLGEKLFVTATTVSKWERGVCYPDINMIPSLCKQLEISEHEFFTACDDLAFNETNKNAEKYKIIESIWKWTMMISYTIALIVCFICNVAIDHTLSWFWIVLVAIMMGFSITNLFFYLKKYKVLDRVIIVSLILSVLTYVLVFTCCWYLKGDWLFTIAIPIITLELALTWLVIFTFKLKINGYFRASIILIILAIIQGITNPICSYLIKQPNESDIIINIQVAIIIVFSAIILFIIGIKKNLQLKK